MSKVKNSIANVIILVSYVSDFALWKNNMTTLGLLGNEYVYLLADGLTPTNPLIRECFTGSFYFISFHPENA